MYYNKLNIYSYIVFIIIVLSFIVLFSLKKKLNDRKVRANLPDLPNAFDYSNKLDIKRYDKNCKFYDSFLSHLVISGGGLHGIYFLKLLVDIQKRYKNSDNNLKTMMVLYSDHIKVKNNKIELIDVEANFDKDSYNYDIDKLNFKNAFFYKNRIYYLSIKDYDKKIPIQYTGKKYIFTKPKNSDWPDDFLELLNISENKINVQKDISDTLIIDKCSIFSANSVGSLLLLGLILKYSPLEIFDLFDDFAYKIFNLNSFSEIFLVPIRLTGFIGSKYSQNKIKTLLSKWISDSPLSQMIKEQTYRYELELPYDDIERRYTPYFNLNVFSNFKDGLTYDNLTFDLLDIIYPSKLFNIMTYNFSLKSISIFTSCNYFSPKNEGLINFTFNKDKNLCFTKNKLVDICLASSAVPYFFKPITMPNYYLKDNPNNVYADGLISGANIPINFGLIISLIILKRQELLISFKSKVNINTLVMQKDLTKNNNYKPKYGISAFNDLILGLLDSTHYSTKIMTDGLTSLKELTDINDVFDFEDPDKIIPNLEQLEKTINFDTIFYCKIKSNGNVLSFNDYLKNKKELFGSPDFFDQSIIDLDKLKIFLPSI